jgi:hypothetical protein
MLFWFCIRCSRPLQIIATKGDETSNNIIRHQLNMSPQTLSYNIKQLVKKSRIEINAVIAQVGDERFWDFIMDKVM